jgi:predicted phosphodiesterase
MSNKHERITGKIIKEYLTKFPDTPNLTLAKKIYKENPQSFSNVESVRTSIRGYRGSAGNKSRSGYKPTFFHQQPKNAFDLPDSHADSYEPFLINQSKTLIISDMHFPYQHNKAIELALNYGLEKKVNCILINGDLIDFATISRHEKDFRSRKVSEEFEAVRQFLQAVRKAFPKTRIVYKYGNHDERWEKWLYLKAPEIFDCTDFQMEVIMRLGELNIEVVKDKRPIKIGKLTVLHGHENTGSSGGVNPARSTFVKTLNSVIVGHYHKTSLHSEARMDGEIISVHSTGCLSGLHPLFLPINKWNLGFAYVELDIKTGEYVVDNKMIIKNKVY